MPPLPKALQEGNCFSPCDPRDLHTKLPAPRPLPPFPTGTPLSRPDMTPVIVWTSETSDFELHCLYKLAVVRPSPFPSHWFWGRFFLVQSPACCFTFSSLSLSLSLLSQGSGLLPLHSTHSSSLCKSTLHSSYLPQCGHFSPSRYAVCSLSPQMDLLGFQNDLIST